MDLDQTCQLMAENIPHVLKLLRMAAGIDHMMLLSIDDMNMRGSQIWTAYYLFCEGWFQKFRVMVAQRNLDMVNFVNSHHPAMRAVQRGGAPK